MGRSAEWAALRARARAVQADLRVDLEGAYTLSLSDLNGSRREGRRASGAGEHIFHAPRPGLHLLEVRQGAHVHVRPLMF